MEGRAITVMRLADLFVRHAQRLRERARRARRLASAVPGDVVQERLLSLAERAEARSGVAEQCAEKAIRRENETPKRNGAPRPRHA